MDDLIVNIIETIVESGNRGKELMIDSFVLGVAWGRKILITEQDIKKAVNYLYDVNKQLEESQQSPFQKLELFNKFLIDDNYNIFTQKQEDLRKNIENQQNKKQEDLVQMVCYQKKKNRIINQKICSICDFYINDLDEEKCQIQQCGHQFHNLCLYFKIDQQGLTNCPTCKCQLNSNLKEQIFQKISKSFKSCCPNPTCDIEFIYFGQPIFYCSKCNIQCCLNCKSLASHETCTLQLDHFEMGLGIRFKICFYCFNPIFQNFQDINSHNCQNFQDQIEMNRKIYQF
ncbi:unnamed protein product [Paramecium sonneborni]|uniref:RING-type domain-containing protein n=1 Tax=Paramecium sonneborni TaxID=65129 RepID=A0A8S1PHA5_9CILI|nr:unnamed protein product [Paramecium sonneborni]